MTAQQLIEQELLENEELEEKMAGAEQGEIEILLGHYLAGYVYPQKLGRVFGSQTTFVIGGTPPKRQPDVAFVTLERMPERIEGEVPFVPDLAVEIISPTDTNAEVDKKILQYQQAEVRLIWIIRPLLKMVEVYHPGDLKPASTPGINDELDGEDIIPGFKLKVSALFEY